MKQIGPVMVGAVMGIVGLVGIVCAASMDPLEVGHHVYTKKLENARVRVMELAIKPGDTIPMHSHPDHFAYITGAGTLQLTYPDGTTQSVQGNVGDVLWIPAESHATENVGTTEVRALIVELK